MGTDPNFRAFMAAAGEGILLAPRCTQCGHWAAPYSFRGLSPAICPACQSPSPEWRPVSSVGVLVTWTTLPRTMTGRAATVTGIVELVEGPWLPCLIDLPPDQVRAGLELKICFPERDSGGGVRVPVGRLR